MTDEARKIVSKGQLRKRRKDGWTRRDERLFLSHLRATCNVSASARAIGKTPSKAHDLRSRDPVFAAGWEEALREGRLRLHGKLIVHAETGGVEPVFDEDGEPIDSGPGLHDPELALKLLKFHADSEQGGRRGRPGPPPVSDEELTAALLCQLDLLDRRLAMRRA